MSPGHTSTTRVGVVDIGTNSTRLLVAQVGDGTLEELERRSIVTRLGQGVDTAGRLADEAMARVLAALDEYAPALAGCDARVGVLTSAVRDADNGAGFTKLVRDRYGIDARTLSGDEEAQLTFIGATAARDPDDDTTLLVCDIGGGSTELVTGARGMLGFHVSTQAGVVRHSERHLRSDPPRPEELEALAADVRALLTTALPPEIRAAVEAAVAVAGTATSCAAIDLALDDPAQISAVEGHVLTRATLEGLRDRLAALPLAERRKVRGLHPDRAPTIVAGVLVLLEVLALVGLERVEVSDRDILWGAALRAR